VGVTEHNGELPEVLVERHEDAILLNSERQNLIVPRRRGPVADPDDVMTASCELGRRAGPDAGVEQ
jgi:hypothetical protein